MQSSGEGQRGSKGAVIGDARRRAASQHLQRRCRAKRRAGRLQTRRQLPPGQGPGSVAPRPAALCRCGLGGPPGHRSGHRRQRGTSWSSRAKVTLLVPVPLTAVLLMAPDKPPASSCCACRLCSTGCRLVAVAAAARLTEAAGPGRAGWVVAAAMGLSWSGRAEPAAAMRARERPASVAGVAGATARMLQRSSASSSLLPSHSASSKTTGGLIFWLDKGDPSRDLKPNACKLDLDYFCILNRVARVPKCKMRDLCASAKECRRRNFGRHRAPT